MLKLSENLVSLRKKKQTTQEELAAFIGVTKASVSKWETGQSMPDILLLPQLAAFFDVSVDRLLGYEPQLSKEQIQQIYLDFTAAFAKRPFDEVLAEVRSAVHKYYSCYPFLLQMCTLYLNHFQLAKDPEKMQNLVRETEKLCEHIVRDCKTVSICNEAISLKAMCDLQLGRADEVIEALEESSDPMRISGQNNALLLSAYQTAGKPEQAADYAQITIYMHLLLLIGTSVQYLAIHADDRRNCEETIRRIDSVAETYRLAALHPNCMAQFDYQAALCLTGWGEFEKAIERLHAYEKAVLNLAKSGNCILHGDAYFDRIEKWFDQLPLGVNPPRSVEFVVQSAVQSLQNPAFQPLHGLAEFEAILKRLKGEN